MTTGELIKMLQEADPSGELPVCVGNHDVYFVQNLPAYYDGPLQQLVHDESKRGECWSIVGAKITTRGMKVDIVPLSIREAMLDHPDLPVECEGSHTAERVDEWRRDVKELCGP